MNLKIEPAIRINHHRSAGQHALSTRKDPPKSTFVRGQQFVQVLIGKLNVKVYKLNWPRVASVIQNNAFEDDEEHALTPLWVTVSWSKIHPKLKTTHAPAFLPHNIECSPQIKVSFLCIYSAVIHEKPFPKVEVSRRVGHFRFWFILGWP